MFDLYIILLQSLHVIIIIIIIMSFTAKIDSEKHNGDEIKWQDVGWQTTLVVQEYRETYLAIS